MINAILNRSSTFPKGFCFDCLECYPGMYPRDCCSKMYRYWTTLLRRQRLKNRFAQKQVQVTGYEYGCEASSVLVVLMNLIQRQAVQQMPSRPMIGLWVVRNRRLIGEYREIGPRESVMAGVVVAALKRRRKGALSGY